MPFNPKDLGVILQMKRKAKGITQEKLAEAISVSPGYISQIERGITVVNLDTLHNIANSLECNMADFFTVPKTDSNGAYVLQDGSTEEERVTTVHGYIEEEFGIPFCAENYPQIIHKLADRLSSSEQASFCYILASYLLSHEQPGR